MTRPAWRSNLSDAVISSPSSGQILSYNGTSWVNSAGGGTWNTIANPTAAQALTMAAWPSTWTYNATTGAGADMFKITDTASNTGTGYLENITTAASSATSPLHLKVTGVGDPG